MNESREVFVYIFSAKTNDLIDLVKIGITAEVQKRKRTVQTSCPFEIEIVHVFACPDREIASAIERAFHVTQAKHKMIGEWFKIKPLMALFLMVMNFEAAFSVNMPDFDEMNLIRELCGIDSAREKLSRGTVGQ
jgi:hypothetical protein